MEAKRQDIGMDIDEDKKDTQNKTNTQEFHLSDHFYRHIHG